MVIFPVKMEVHGVGYVERCLWDYRENLASIDMMREELAGLMSVQGHDYGGSEAGGSGDPVSRVCERAMTLERNIRKAEKMTVPITRMAEGLCGSDLRIHQIREVFRLRYFEHENKEMVIRTAGISEKTYYRRCSDIKRMARKYFGEWG